MAAFCRIFQVTLQAPPDTLGPRAGLRRRAAFSAGWRCSPDSVQSGWQAYFHLRWRPGHLLEPRRRRQDPRAAITQGQDLQRRFYF
jgi:hypothetical protein